jgi:AraC-like DNA-binding protein
MAGNALSLRARPRLVQCGLALHGAKSREAHLQRECWSLHFYHYAGRLRAEGRTYRFQAESASLIPPGCEAEWQFPPHASHYYAHFKSGPGAGEHGPFPLLREAAALPPGLGMQFDDLVRRFDAGERLRANVRLWDILFQVVQPEESPPPHLHPHLQIALAVLRNSGGRTPGVRTLAAGMGVSRNQLTRLFRREFDCSAKEYIQRERVQRALALLDRSSLSVKSIAAVSGFYDLAHFNKVVRRETGLCPTRYRQRALSGR